MPSLVVVAGCRGVRTSARPSGVGLPTCAARPCLKGLRSKKFAKAMNHYPHGSSLAMMRRAAGAVRYWPAFAARMYEFNTLPLLGGCESEGEIGR